MGGGASQPGMTGLVKEEILTRWENWASSYIMVRCASSQPCCAETNSAGEHALNYVAMDGKTHTLMLTPRSLAFTCCQVPIIYELARDAASDSRLRLCLRTKTAS